MAKMQREGFDKKGEGGLDKRKIVLGFISILFLLGVLAYGTKTAVLGERTMQQGVAASTADTQNSSIHKTNSFSLQNTFQDKVSSLKDEVGKLNVDDVATSSPQIQKVLRDIQSLKDYPHNQAKSACVQICDKF